MPTDGTLLLEHMPRGKQYLVTALSVFFSFGSVLSAIVGIIVIPGYSCPARKEGDPPCDVASMNKGWQYLLMAVGLIVRVFLKLFSPTISNVYHDRHCSSLLPVSCSSVSMNPHVTWFMLGGMKKPYLICGKFPVSMETN